MSMVELLVTMAITLIATVIIFQVFEVSEGIKRTATSGGDANQNGVIALYVMERDLRNGGMGINDAPLAGCAVVGWDSARAGNNFAATLLPVLITPGADATTPDTVNMFYGSQTHIMGATRVSADMVAATETAVRVTNRYGFRTGDLIMLLEPGTTKDCVIREVTSLPTAQSDQIVTDTGNYTLAGGGTAASRFNRSGGIGVLYVGANTANATRVFNLGNLYDANGATMPVHNTYSIIGNNLAVASLFNPIAATPVADNIVHLRAEYALADGTFSNAAPNWANVIGVRLAVVARSALAEKPSGTDGAKCDTTTDGTETTPGPDRTPRWSGGVFDVSASGDADPTSMGFWKCFRYRVFETRVPLRNWIWRSS